MNKARNMTIVFDRFNVKSDTITCEGTLRQRDKIYTTVTTKS